MKGSKNNPKVDYKSELETIKQDFHKFAQQKAKKYGKNSLHLECFPPKYNEEWIMYMEETEKKIDVLRTKIPAKDELQLNLLLIKEFCVIRRLLGLKATNPDKFMQISEPIVVKCEKALKPYKNKAQGVWLYVMGEVLFVQLINMRNSNSMAWYSSHCQADFKKGLIVIEDAEKRYTDFVNFQMEKPWGIDEIFRCSDAQGNALQSGLADDFRKFREYTIKQLLMEFAVKTENEPKIRKYGLDGLRTYMHCHQHHQTLHMLVRYAVNVVQPFTNVHHFKQAQHIIGVIMYLVVQFRRSLPPDERKTVNPIQYDASYLYAEFGNRLVRKSQELIMEAFFRQSGLSIEGHRNFHHDDCERLLPKSKELSLYENQFPTELTTDGEVYKKMQKKIRQWLDRMEELKRDNMAPHGLCLDPYPTVIERVPTIEAAAEMPVPTLQK